MHKYFITIPRIVQKIFSRYVWSIPTKEKEVYLTFDDGPHESVTPWVLNELNKYNAKATFFCIGSNVQAEPIVYNRILAEGHAVGNHTYDHPNGWDTDTETYLDNIRHAATVIHSPLFRPPYGRIKTQQAKKIKAVLGENARIIMWEVLSADFDPSFSKEQCLRNVMKNVKPGSIIVFHDSEKAFKNLEYALPVVLKELAGEGYLFKKIG